MNHVHCGEVWQVVEVQCWKLLGMQILWSITTPPTTSSSPLFRAQAFPRSPGNNTIRKSINKCAASKQASNLSVTGISAWSCNWSRDAPSYLGSFDVLGSISLYLAGCAAILAHSARQLFWTLSILQLARTTECMKSLFRRDVLSNKEISEVRDEVKTNSSSH